MAELLQKRVLSKIIIDFCKVEVKPDTSKEPSSQLEPVSPSAVESAALHLQHALAPFDADNAADKVEILDKGFGSQIVKLKLLLNANEIDGDVDVRALDQARLELVGTKSGLLHKPLTLFATGLYISNRANERVIQHRTDEKLNLQIQSLRSEIDKLKVPQRSDCGRQDVGKSPVDKRIQGVGRHPSELLWALQDVAQGDP